MRFLLWSALLLPSLCYAADPSFSYRDTKGIYHSILVASPLGSNNTPYVSAYKDKSGQWKPTIVIQQACGLDSSDFPVICNNLNTTQINVPDGIAGLNSSGKVTVSVQAPTVETDSSYSDSSGAVVSTPLVALGSGSADAIAGGSDSLWFGGFPLPAITNAAGDPATSAITNIIARPYGNYNNGCALCLIATGGTQTDSAGRAAISGGDWRGGVSANNGMGDIVGLYEHLDAEPARLVLPVSSYTATSVVLSSALTPAQQNQMRVGMYIWSNSIDPTVTDTGSSSNSLPTPRFYGAYVTGWSGKTITVNGWSVSQQTPVSGTVPSTAHLDTSIYSSRSTPTVWLGTPSKVFARNVYEEYAEPTAGSETSLVHDFEGEEMDFRYTATTPHHVHYNGLTITPQALGGITDGTAFTDDSVEVGLSGGVPIQLQLDGNCNAREIMGWAVYVASPCSNMTSSTTVGTTYTLSENVARADNNSIRQVLRLQQDTAGANPNLYLGPVVTPGSNPSIYNVNQSWYGQVNGYINGALKYGLSDSSISLCGAGTNCSLTVASDGTINTTHDILMGDGKSLTILGNGMKTYAYADQYGNLTLLSGSNSHSGFHAQVTAYSQLPTSDAQGTQLWCSDCYSTANSAKTKGVPVWWNGSAWTDALGSPIGHS